MTQENKDLLLKDLCARLPYGVKVNNEIQGDFNIYGFCENIVFVRSEIGHIDVDVEKIKPYLFPLSSMTENQKEELKQEIDKQTEILIERMKNDDCGIDEGKYHFHSLLELEWCLKNHFDIYGLIPMGLAIDATDKNIY